MLYATRRINLKSLTSEQSNMLKQLCILSKEVYNMALQNIETHYSNTGQLLFWLQNYRHLKDSQAYKWLGSRYQAIVKEADSNYKTYVSNVTNGQKYGNRFKMYENWDKLKPPAPKEYFFPLICESFEMKDGKIKLPLSKEYRLKYENLYFPVPEDLKDSRIAKFIVRPKFNFSQYELLLIYEATETDTQLKPNEALAIDLGVSNFATCVTSLNQSFIIDGKYLKSIIQGFWKSMSEIRYFKKKQNTQGYTHKEKSLINRREAQVNDYLNKSVAYIIQHCLKYRIGNIVVGYGMNFQKSPNLGHRNNQIFSQMPYLQFITKLKFQCKKYGIQFSTIDECYSSKASFYDNDPLPDYISSKKWKFSGTRRYRGLYIASDGRKINADCNGAANILRKAIAQGKCKLVSLVKIRDIQFRGLVQPMRIRPLRQTSHKMNKTL